MVDVGIVVKLARAFPGGFLNGQGEFIAHEKGNAYFLLTDCDTELDVKGKVLEWLSRDAYKSTPFHRVVQNIKFRRFIFDGICKFLEHDFSFEDMEEIYTHIGNRANHAKTVRFIESGYDLSVLKEG